MTFAYPPRPAARFKSGSSHNLTSQPALEKISFHLSPGNRLAIVGPSGAGKSTLAGLLLRFWEPQSGEILLRLEGNPSVWRDASAFNSYELRSRIGVLSQHTYLFAANLQDNLRLARPKATQEEIEIAARQAHLHAWIETLPEGYATWIGEHPAPFLLMPVVAKLSIVRTKRAGVPAATELPGPARGSCRDARGNCRTDPLARTHRGTAPPRVPVRPRVSARREPLVGPAPAGALRGVPVVRARSRSGPDLGALVA